MTLPINLSMNRSINVLKESVTRSISTQDMQVMAIALFVLACFAAYLAYTLWPRSNESSNKKITPQTSGHKLGSLPEAEFPQSPSEKTIKKANSSPAGQQINPSSGKEQEGSQVNNNNSAPVVNIPNGVPLSKNIPQKSSAPPAGAQKTEGMPPQYNTSTKLNGNKDSLYAQPTQLRKKTKEETDKQYQLELQKIKDLMKKEEEELALAIQFSLDESEKSVKKTPPQTPMSKSSTTAKNPQDDALKSTTKANSPLANAALDLAVNKAKENKKLKIVGHAIEKNEVSNAYLVLHFKNSLDRTIALEELRSKHNMFSKGSKDEPERIVSEDKKYQSLKFTVEQTIEFQQIKEF